MKSRKFKIGDKVLVENSPLNYYHNQSKIKGKICFCYYDTNCYKIEFKNTNIGWRDSPLSSSSFWEEKGNNLTLLEPKVYGIVNWCKQNYK